jgi:hypothetical protein
VVEEKQMAAVSEYAIKNRKKYFSDWYIRNKEKISIAAKANYKKNRERILAKQKESDYPRENRYKRIYGISIEEYNQMLSDQNGVCAICGTDVVDKHGRRKHWCVDHCHTTGVVRGLLCISCNQFLGKYEKLHLSAAKYLLINEEN